MIAITNTLFKFANSFDLKDWDGLKSILADDVLCDYMDLRGVIETLSADEYVAKRIAALDHLKTQHLFANVEVHVDNATAHCRLNAFIIRNDAGRHFHTHAIYDFTLVEQKLEWKITTIKQTVLWNEGDFGIHAGAKAS